MKKSRKHNPNASLAFYDSGELPERRKNDWYLPTLDGTGRMVKVTRFEHHVSEFNAAKYGFINVAPPNTYGMPEYQIDWWTQSIVREYAVWLFFCPDEFAPYSPYINNVKPFNQAARQSIARHVKPVYHTYSGTPTFDYTAWNEIVVPMCGILEMVRFNEDFMQLREQMVDAYGLENLVNIGSKLEYIRDVELKMRNEKDVSKYCKLFHLLADLNGWQNNAPQIEKLLACNGFKH